MLYLMTLGPFVPLPTWAYPWLVTVQVVYLVVLMAKPVRSWWRQRAVLS